MDGGAWWAAVHGVAKSQTRLSDFTFTFRFHALEKEMATHSSVLAWRIPGTGEPGGLPSMGSHRVRHDWSDLAAAAAVLLLRSKWAPEIFCLCQNRFPCPCHFNFPSLPSKQPNLSSRLYLPWLLRVLSLFLNSIYCLVLVVVFSAHQASPGSLNEDSALHAFMVSTVIYIKP